MRRFRFRLASVLRLRSQIERSARKELASAMADVNLIDQQLRAAEQGLLEFGDQSARTDSAGALARALESGLRRHQWRLVRQRKKVEQRLETVRADYTVKARDLKTLRRLRDQEYETWRTESQRAEQSELDELATLTRGNRSANEEEAGEW